MKTFDQWESDSKWTLEIGEYGIEASQRVLALIDLVKKKDEALKRIAKAELGKIHEEASSVWAEYVAKEALALTEKFDEENR